MDGWHTHLHALLQGLLDAAADHEGEDALGLVVLDHFRHGGGVIRLAQDHGHAGDVARDQGHAQGADDGVGDEADAGVGLVGVGIVHVLEALDGDEALEHAHAGGQVAQGLDLHACGGVDGGEEVGGVGEGGRGFGPVLGDGVVYRALCQSSDGVGTGIDQISQCAHRNTASC